MCDAYDVALLSRPFPLSLDFVRLLGQTIEPIKNLYGFRTTPVYFGDVTRQAIPAMHVEQALTNLLHYGQNLSVEEGYIEFERIHPFNDGNGRVGAILYNIFCGTLEFPKTPPEFPTDNFSRKV